jgi:hypothetical protein
MEAGVKIELADADEELKLLMSIFPFYLAPHRAVLSSRNSNSALTCFT